LTQNVYWKDVLIQAMVEEHLIFHFQPVADALTKKTVYYEALLRLKWQTEELPCLANSCRLRNEPGLTMI